MQNRVEFGGSWFRTVREAATVWADSALPDVSMIEAGEDAGKAAADLEDYCWGEAQKIGEGAPENVDEDEWREACRAALVDRIQVYRAAA